MSSTNGNYRSHMNVTNRKLKLDHEIRSWSYFDSYNNNDKNHFQIIIDILNHVVHCLYSASSINDATIISTHSHATRYSW